mmetsp:Transcript_45946/g.71910  ORF Transcript_45946/g.71910 Transcript_45946/m.71910 type:complete len:230 (-) Transcript_45946:473-1162(-)
MSNMSAGTTPSALRAFSIVCGFTLAILAGTWAMAFRYSGLACSASRAASCSRLRSSARRTRPISNRLASGVSASCSTRSVRNRNLDSLRYAALALSSTSPNRPPSSCALSSRAASKCACETAEPLMPMRACTAASRLTSAVVKGWRIWSMKAFRSWSMYSITMYTLSMLLPTTISFTSTMFGCLRLSSTFVSRRAVMGKPSFAASRLIFTCLSATISPVRRLRAQNTTP